MSKIQAVLDEFMPCGGTVCPGCEVACKYVDGRTPDADRMADAIIDLRAERDALRKGLLDLLAVVHRDGGHHTEAVGTRQSVVDAELAVHALRKDAARLDAIESGEVHIECMGMTLRHMNVYSKHGKCVTSGLFGTQLSLTFRQAIDAAMAVQP